VFDRAFFNIVGISGFTPVKVLFYMQFILYSYIIGWLFGWILSIWWGRDLNRWGMYVFVVLLCSVYLLGIFPNVLGYCLTSYYN